MSGLFSPIKLAGVLIPGNLFLAPLAGYTDKAFRELCLEFGASLVFTEMVSAEAIARGNEKSLRLMERAPGEEQLAIQIFLSSPDQARRALPALLSYNPTIIDLNCGCPVPKVTKTGAGAALMRSPNTIAEIVRVLAGATDIPISVKIRSGWDSREINYLDAAEAAAAAGASMISIHPRTRTQGYAGRADWQHISKLASEVDLPVIGSGDLFSPEDARRMLQETGCSGVMFARGAVGNPDIFQRTRRLLENGTTTEAMEGTARLRLGLKHLDKSVRYKGERNACKEMKKHFGAYTKGMPGGAAIRNELMRCSTYQEYRSLIETY